MRELTERELLLDLAKLLIKYGPEPFENLAKFISSPNNKKQFINMIMSFSSAASVKKIDTSNTTSKKKTIRSKLEPMQLSEPKKHELLVGFYNDLKNEHVLPTLFDIREFAMNIGLNNTSKESRNIIINRIILDLSEMPMELIEKKIGILKTFDKKNGDLEGWTKIILDSNKTTKNE